MVADSESMEVLAESVSLRVRRLQRLVCEHGLDALLLVGGVDSRFSVGCTQALGFALLGRSNRCVVEAAGLGEHDPAWEDSVLLLRPDSVAAYVPDGDLASTLRNVLHAHQVQLFQPTPQEVADPDAIEDVKLAAVVQMLRGAKRLGMPVGVPPEGVAPPLVCLVKKCYIIKFIQFLQVGKKF